MAKEKFRVTSRLISELSERRIFTTVNKNEKSWLRVGETVTFDNDVHSEPYSAIRAGKKFCSMGAFTYSRSPVPTSLQIGRYTAIALGLEIMGVDHPMDRLSMVGFDYSKRSIFDAARADFNQSSKLIPLKSRKLRPLSIGNDVWIGNDVLLARNIKIGNGAVIAARSIVTKDVPDYAIVAGSPAVVKRMRFSEQLVSKLTDSRWWEYKFTDFAEMDTTRPEIFVDQLSEALSSKRLSAWTPQKIHLNAVFSQYAEKLA